jgi:two-component system cell cycle response regulator
LLAGASGSNLASGLGRAVRSELLLRAARCADDAWLDRANCTPFTVRVLKRSTLRPIARVVPSIPRILVAEDSRSQRAVVVGLLRDEGFEVHEAADGRVALDLCRIARPDLLVLDLGLPQLAGWEVMARVRSDSKLRTMPIIVITADGKTDTVTAALDAGATDFVAKPAQPDELLARVRRVLRENARLDQLVHRNRVLGEAAELDALTRLPNRRACADALTLAAGVAQELSRPLSVALVDVDHFKAINDSYGHPVGDEVLRVLAGRFSDRIRSVELVGRWGGEEFIAILPNAEPSRAAEAAEALRTAGESQPIAINGLTVPVTVSVGWASGSDIAPDRLIELADAALYQAKTDGRNRVRAASRPQNAQARSSSLFRS